MHIELYGISNAGGPGVPFKLTLISRHMSSGEARLEMDRRNQTDKNNWKYAAYTQAGALVCSTYSGGNSPAR